MKQRQQYGSSNNRRGLIRRPGRGAGTPAGGAGAYLGLSAFTPDSPISRTSSSSPVPTREGRNLSGGKESETLVVSASATKTDIETAAEIAATDSALNLADSSGISGRKTEHIRICLEEDVEGAGVTTGFERYRFRHNALPELDFNAISLETKFLGRRLGAPLLISSMTGGSAAGGSINERLAEAAERRGWAMGVGSVRAAVERAELAPTFAVRRYAPTIPVIANLGAVQLNYGFSTEDARRAVEIAEADMLVLHLNSLQEVFQPEGNTAFGGLLKKIEMLCLELGVPVGVKEVGWGIDGETAQLLHGAGVAFIDVAGAGGTSWSQVEKFRSPDRLRRMAAETFAGWGHPTAECVREVRGRLPEAVLIASGGLGSGLDAAKAIALGADLAGFGRALLGPAVASEALVEEQLARTELELRVAMFGVGAGTIRELQQTERLVRQS